MLPSLEPASSDRYLLEEGVGWEVSGENERKRAIENQDGVMNSTLKIRTVWLT